MVLVNKSHLDELRRLANEHKNCHKTVAIDKKGDGNVGPSGDQTDSCVIEPSCVPQKQSEFSDQRASVFSKTYISEEQPEVETANKAHNISKGSEVLNEEVILSKVRKKFKKKAHQLLLELASHPETFSYDEYETFILFTSIGYNFDEIVIFF